MIKTAFCILLLCISITGCEKMEPISKTIPASCLPYSPDPDTLLFRSSVHLQANIDSQLNIPFFHLDLSRGIRTHEGWDWSDISSRYIEAMTLIMRSDILHGEVASEFSAKKKQLLKTWLNSFGEKGLSWRQQSSFSDVEADIFDQSSSMMALITLYEFDGDENWLNMASDMAAALLGLAVEDEKGGLYFEFPTYNKDLEKGPGRNNYEITDPAHHGGRLLLPLGRLLMHRSTEESKILAQGLAIRLFGTSGAFDIHGKTSGHVHSRISSLAGAILIARYFSDMDLENKARKAFHALKELAGPLGIYPEQTDTVWSETCAVSDALLTCLILGDDKARNQADKIYFNQLSAAQSRFKSGRDEITASISGAWPGYATHLSWGHSTMNCCSAAGVQGVYAYSANAVKCDEYKLVVYHLCPGIHDGIEIEYNIKPLKYDLQNGLPLKSATASGNIQLNITKNIPYLILRIPDWLKKHEPELSLENLVEVNNTSEDFHESFASFKSESWKFYKINGETPSLKISYSQTIQPKTVKIPSGNLKVYFNGPFAEPLESIHYHQEGIVETDGSITAVRPFQVPAPYFDRFGGNGIKTDLIIDSENKDEDYSSKSPRYSEQPSDRMSSYCFH